MSSQEDGQKPPDGEKPSAKHGAIFGLLPILLAVLGAIPVFGYYSGGVYYFISGITDILGVAAVFVAIALALGIAALTVAVIGLRRHGRRRMTVAGLILAVLVVAIGMVQAASVFNAYATIHLIEHAEFTVDYTATAEGGTTTVLYGGLGAESKTEQFSGVWSKEVVAKRSELNASLIVYSLNGPTPDSEKSCEIKINGRVVSQETGTDVVQCFAQFTP